MGGPATGFLAGFPAPTVERGAVMAHGAGGHAGHAAGAQTSSAQPGSAAAGGHRHDAAMHGDSAHQRMMDDLHQRMMSDPAELRRVMADSSLHRMMMEMVERMPAAHRDEMMRMMHGDARRVEPSPARPQRAPRRSTPAQPDHPGHPNH